MISDPSEKNKILNDLAEGQRDVLCKPLVADASLFVSTAVTVIGSYLMVRPQRLGVLRPEDDTLIIQFQLGNQKYIAQVVFKRSEELLALSMNKKLFRIQRREFFRLKLPATYKGTLKITQMAADIPNRAFQLVDISGGGCKIEVPDEVTLAQGVPFSAILKMLARAEISIKGIIRHKSKIDKHREVQWLGVQFLDQSPADSSKLVGLVMDLHREFFSRL